MMKSIGTFAETLKSHSAILSANSVASLSPSVPEAPTPYLRTRLPPYSSQDRANFQFRPQNRSDLGLYVYSREAADNRKRPAILRASNHAMLNIPAVRQRITSDA